MTLFKRRPATRKFRTTVRLILYILTFYLTIFFAPQFFMSKIYKNLFCNSNRDINIDINKSKSQKQFYSKNDSESRELN